MTKRPKYTSGTDAVKHVMRSTGVSWDEAVKLLKARVAEGKIGVRWAPGAQPKKPEGRP